MAVDRDEFARECVRQGVIFGVEPHYLLGVAQLRSSISDDTKDGKVGPYRLTQAEWDANREIDEFDVHLDADEINDATTQCIVFGLMAHRVFDAFFSANTRNPSAKELYLQQWPGAATPTLEADFQKALDDTAPLLGPASNAILGDPQATEPVKNPEQMTTRPVPPASTGGEPPWYTMASGEIGKREIDSTNTGPDIDRYIRLAQCGSPGQPWCAIFANAMFASCNPPIAGTRSPASRSFSTNSNFVKLDGPALGAVAVFWRGSPSSEQGHVGFYRGETAESIYVLGGNEGNMVQIAPMSKPQLIGYWWPKAVSLPGIAKITLPPGTPSQRTRVT